MPNEAAEDAKRKKGVQRMPKPVGTHCTPFYYKVCKYLIFRALRYPPL